MDQKDFLALATKVADGKASDEELRRYAAVFEHFRQAAGSSWEPDKYGDEQRIAAELRQRLQPAVPPKHRPVILRKHQPAAIRRVWPSAAAAVLLVVLVGAHFLLRRRVPEPSRLIAVKADVAPGHNQATLTLAGGDKIILTQQLHGQIALQGQTRIEARDGQLVYRPGTGKQDTGCNTLTTARGEQSPYPIVLADGTRVWLNAESSLTFPAAFPGKERNIRLSGEAYFEVKHDAAHPFIVHTAGGTVEDIGTRFDINAYADENQEATTLLEGAVRVTTHTGARRLHPGQQANYKQGKITVQNVDAEEAIAWKNGYFMFTDAALADVMKQLSRWYDVDVQFEDQTIERLTFVASITRYTSISRVLRVLEMTKQVHFKIEGKTIRVYSGKAG